MISRRPDELGAAVAACAAFAATGRHGDRLVWRQSGGERQLAVCRSSGALFGLFDVWRPRRARRGPHNGRPGRAN